MVGIKKGRTNLVQKAIDDILEAVVDPGGVQGQITVSHLDEQPSVSFKAFEVQDPKFVIASSLTGVDTVSLQWRESIAIRAINDLYLSQQRTIDDFCLAFERRLTQWRSRPQISFTVYASVDADSIPAWLLPRRVLGIRVYPTTFRAAQREAGIVDLLNTSEWIHSEADELEQISFPYMAAKGNFRDAEEAFSGLTEPFELIRSALNISATSRTIQWHLGPPRARAEHHAPAVYAAISEHGEVQAAYGTFVAPFRRKAVAVKAENDLKILLRGLKGKPQPKSSLDRLRRAILAFGNALDMQKPQDELLALWTTLEIIANSDKGNTDDVINRICNLWVDGVDVVKPLLENIAPLRNKFVHLGEFETGHSHPIRVLHKTCTDAIWRFSALATSLQTDADFDAYFSAATQSNADLVRRVKVAKLIQRMRNATSS